jgi:DNA-binding NtrC family response regulator
VLERARNRTRVNGSGDPLIEGHNLDLGGGRSTGEPTTGAPKQSPAAAPTVKAAQDAIREKWDELSGRREAVDGFEKEVIEEALEAFDGIIARAARLLSVPRTGLISRMDKLEIDPDKFKDRQR